MAGTCIEVVTDSRNLFLGLLPGSASLPEKEGRVCKCSAL
jgi:hypothetical protein